MKQKWWKVYRNERKKKVLTFVRKHKRREKNAAEGNISKGYC